MKKNLNFRIIPILFIGIACLLLWSCKKDSSTSTPTILTGTVTDFDGNVYPTIKIGTQTWMAANLKTTKYRNGTSIPHVTDSIQWSTLATPGYCCFNNDAAMATTYGLFYNWYAATDSNNIAPAGWHVPTDTDFQTLITYLGSGAGGKLKCTDTTYWNSPNTGATNSSGFNALAAGDRSYTGLFHYLGMYGCWWCTMETSSTDAIEYVTLYNSSNVTRMAYSKGLGLSVRCVKD
jgi:uncharacterized protein (TIGR02145 family)